MGLIFHDKNKKGIQINAPVCKKSNYSNQTNKSTSALLIRKAPESNPNTDFKNKSVKKVGLYLTPSVLMDTLKLTKCIFLVILV